MPSSAARPGTAPSQVAGQRAGGASGLPRWVRPVLVANLVAQVGIVVTGGLVRLTGSGLGCPTWPQCVPGSYTPVVNQPQGWHKDIEFGNRLLTSVVSVLAIAALVAVFRVPDGPGGADRRRFRLLGAVPLVGVAAQAVLGGFTVLTGLNPTLVAAHFLLSMLLIAGSTTLLLVCDDRAERLGEQAMASTGPTSAGLTSQAPASVGSESADPASGGLGSGGLGSGGLGSSGLGSAGPASSGPLQISPLRAGPLRPEVRRLAVAVAVVAAVVLCLGTVVTGSGPHSGDAVRPARFGIDPRTASWIHADAVWLFVGLVVALLLALRLTQAPARAQRRTRLLLIVTLGQGVIGYAQYFTGLPIGLVSLHTLGASLLVVAVTGVLHAVARDDEYLAR